VYLPQEKRQERKREFNRCHGEKKGALVEWNDTTEKKTGPLQGKLGFLQQEQRSKEQAEPG